ncbi:MAG: hypothetical protein LWW92_05505 [Rhodocyclales bacterium]|nr:hypothetical protein [Rhodocyclales bacterium]
MHSQLTIGKAFSLLEKSIFASFGWVNCRFGKIIEHAAQLHERSDKKIILNKTLKFISAKPLFTTGCE